MSKIIRITDECIEEIKNDFLEALSSAKLSSGKFSFEKSFSNIDRKATLYYSDKAWIKQQSLVDHFDKEVAWHGIAKRCDPEDGGDAYVITDILVYPQEVTGATVTTDQEKYQTWLMSHDDEVFNNIRMQGHSHVNMSTSPSGVDESLYERILDQLDDDMFYIFVIWNKRGEKTIKIYDLAKNILFETKDVEVLVLNDGYNIISFLKSAKESVTVKSYYGGAYGNYGGTYNGGGYNGGYSSYYNRGGVTYQQQQVSTPGSNTSVYSVSEKKKKKKSSKKDKPVSSGEAYFDDDDWGEYNHFQRT